MPVAKDLKAHSLDAIYKRAVGRVVDSLIVHFLKVPNAYLALFVARNHNVVLRRMELE